VGVKRFFGWFLGSTSSRWRAAYNYSALPARNSPQGPLRMLKETIREHGTGRAAVFGAVLLSRTLVL
jgi:hypothetical protein